MWRGSLVALVCASGCLDAPGAGDPGDAHDAALPADGGSKLADAGVGPDADPCGVPFSVAYVDLVHAPPEGGTLEGFLLVVADEVPVELGKLEVDMEEDGMFYVLLTVTSDGVVSPGMAHGGMEASAAGQIAEIVEPERWEVLDRPVLTVVMGAEETLPSIRDVPFALVSGAQRANLSVRIRYAQVTDEVKAQRAVLARSLCVQ